MAREGMAFASRGAVQRWLSLIPVAGCGAFAASTLSIYFRDVAAQAFCAGNFVCVGFRADGRALVAGVTFAILAVALLVGTAVAVTSRRELGRSRTWLAPLLLLSMAASFVTAVALIDLNSTGAGVFEVIPITIWAFVFVGFVVLWVATMFWTSLVGVWRFPARALALVHGAVAFAATFVTLLAALTPVGFL